MDNPVADTAKRVEEEVSTKAIYCSDDEDEDEPTVVSTVPRELHWFRRFTSSRGQPSVLCRWVQIMPVLMVFVQLFVYTPKGDASFVGREWEHFSDGARSLITLATIGLCGALVSPILLVQSVQAALKPGGELEQLGAGRASISVSSERRLRYWRLFLMPVAALCNFMGSVTLFVMAPSVTYRTYILEEDMTKCVPQPGGTQACFKDPLGPAYLFCFGSCLLGLGNCVLLGFWPSMILASALCRDQISKLMVALRTANPSDKIGWQQDVVHPALAIDQSMRALSRGWGNALLGLGLASWCMSFNFFCKAINNEYVDAKEQINEAQGEPGGARVFFVVIFAFFAMVPLLVATEALMSMLNSVRIHSGEECNDRVTWLETSLMRMHHGQGVGFTILGNVIDRRVLRNVGIAMFGSISTGITALFALTEDAPIVPWAGDPCSEINEAQEAAIASFRLAGNESCQYNVTVNGLVVT